jgi:hypothetical protein
MNLITSKPKPEKFDKNSGFQPDFRNSFMHECIQGSAIAPKLFEANVNFIEDRGFWEPNEALNLRVARFWETRRPHSFGTIAAFINEDGSLWQAKAQYPRPDGKGSFQKYEFPKGAGQRAFFPAVSVQDWVWLAFRNGLEEFLPSWVFTQFTDEKCSKSNTRSLLVRGPFNNPLESAYLSPVIDIKKDYQPNPQALACLRFLVTTEPDVETHTSLQHLDVWLQNQTVDTTLSPTWIPSSSIETSSFWQWVQLTNAPITVAEGGKKALAALTQGTIALGITGCYGGYLANETVDGIRIRLPQTHLISDLAPLATPGRVWTIALDQDIKPKAIAAVHNAIRQFSFLLTVSGGQVRIARWDPSEGKGLDDLIVQTGARAWEKAYTQAISRESWLLEQTLSRQVRRQPDLYIKDLEFTAVVEALPQSGIIALLGGKGTGKSKSIAQMLPERYWLSLTPLQSLARDQAQGWGGVFINDGDMASGKLLKGGEPVNGGSVCIPSLLKAQGIQADILILDELTASLEFLLISPLANKGGIRPLLITEFERRIREADLVLIADADLSETALEYIESIRGERAYLVKSSRQALTYSASLFDKRNEALAALLSRAGELSQDKLLWINCDSKGMAKSLSAVLEKTLGSTLTITADTSGGEVEASLLQSQGRDLPELLKQGVRAIVSSPSITQGFSIEAHTELIDSVWGFYTGNSISAHSIAQSPDRVRSELVPRFLWIAQSGRAMSKLSQSSTVQGFLQDFKQISTASHRLLQLQLSTVTAGAIQSLDFDNWNLRMLASLEVRRNQGMRQLRQTVASLLTLEGKKVSVMPVLDRKEITLAGVLLKKAQLAINQENAAQVANAEPITQEQADKLERLEVLRPEQLLSLERYKISAFYHTDEVSVELVLWDRNGRAQREIFALESVLNSQLAQATSLQSIEQSPQSPQDWSRSAIRAWLLEKSGMADLIRNIIQGAVETLTKEAVEHIAEFIRTHSKEFCLAFNWQNISDITNQQLIGQVLRAHGLQTSRKRRGSVYRIDKIHLSIVREILTARAGDPPIQVNSSDRQGGSEGNPPIVLTAKSLGHHNSYKVGSIQWEAAHVFDVNDSGAVFSERISPS